MLAVDLSGSMHGSKIQQARKTAIVFAEALEKAGIPYYIMGFSADYKGYSAYHKHYVTWGGKGKETLTEMKANGNNFDGYSIRYAAKLLENATADEKILFVISDGEPACTSYHSMRVGVADTTQAIKEARKKCTVFGIAIGRGCNPNTLQGMYGLDFAYCEDERMLTSTLCKKLKKVFARKK